MKDDEETWGRPFDRRGERPHGPRASRLMILIGMALVMALAVIAGVVAPLRVEPGNRLSTQEWALASSPGDCRAGDAEGFVYAGSLSNLTDVPLNFVVNVAFDVDGERRALGTRQLDAVPPGSEVPVQVSVPTSFPESVPDVSCRVQVRHRTLG